MTDPETKDMPVQNGRLSLAQLFDIIQGNVTVVIQDHTDAAPAAEDTPPDAAKE